MKLAAKHLPLPPESKSSKIDRFILGYWEQDIWDAHDPMFNKFSKAALDKTHRKMNFSVFSPNLRNEVKFFIISRIQLKNHAFRHTKGIELINNGMNILHVQKWLGHASPEMTLHYAKILDTTMRKSWEEATKQGIFRIDTAAKKPIKVELSEIKREDLIEWEYIRYNLDAVKLELGYCMKPIKQPCPTQANPCLSCRNFCTTPEFISQYELEIRETKAVIDRGRALGRQVWVDKNQDVLDRIEPILETLKEGNLHHQAGKKGREYIGKERING